MMGTHNADGEALGTLWSIRRGILRTIGGYWAVSLGEGLYQRDYNVESTMSSIQCRFTVTFHCDVHVVRLCHRLYDSVISSVIHRILARVYHRIYHREYIDNVPPKCEHHLRSPTSSAVRLPMVSSQWYTNSNSIGPIPGDFLTTGNKPPNKTTRQRPRKY